MKDAGLHDLSKCIYCEFPLEGDSAAKYLLEAERFTTGGEEAPVLARICHLCVQIKRRAEAMVAVDEALEREQIARWHELGHTDVIRWDGFCGLPQTTLSGERV